MRLVLPVALIIISWLTLDMRNITIWLPCIILAVVWFFLAPYMFRRSFAKNVKKLMHEGRVSEFVGDFTLTLQGNTMRYTGKGQTLESAYYRVEKTAHDNERLYIYLGSLTAIIIPKTAFKDAVEEQDFIELLRHKCAAATPV